MRNDIVMGAAFLLSGELSLAIMAAMIKHASSEVPHETLVFVRNLFGLIALLPVIWRHGITDLKTRFFKWHLLRAVVGLTAMYCYFYVLAYIPLAEATLVKLSSPFFIPIIGYLWLRERISHLTLWSITLGFIGVLFVLRPGTENFQPAALIGVAGAAFASMAKVTIRRMAATEPSYRIVFYFGLLATLISGIPLLWGWSTPSPTMWAWLALIGICGTIGQLLMTKAYLVANPGQVGPYTYSSVVYASLMGWFLWGEALWMSTIMGTVLIVAAGLLNLKKSPAGATG